MSSTGFVKLEDVFRQRASTRLTPYSVVLSGMAVGSITATAGVVTIPVASGTMLLDSHQFNFTAANLVTGTLPNGVNNLEVWVRPVRRTPAVSTLPGATTDGSYCFLTIPCDENTDYLDKIYVYRTGPAAWLEANEYVNYGEKSAIYAPNTPYYRNLPFSEITGGVLSLKDEKSILYKPSTGLPPEISPANFAASYARYASGFKLADVTVTLTGGAIATPATDLVVKRLRQADVTVA